MDLKKILTSKTFLSIAGIIACSIAYAILAKLGLDQETILKVVAAIAAVFGLSIGGLALFKK